MSCGPRLPELLHAVAADGGAVFLIGDDGNHGERAYSIGRRGVDADLAGTVPARVERARARRRAVAAKLIVVDSDRAPRLSIGVPLLAGNRAIGVVTLLFSRSRAS